MEWRSRWRWKSKPRRARSRARRHVYGPGMRCAKKSRGVVAFVVLVALALSPALPPMTPKPGGGGIWGLWVERGEGGELVGREPFHRFGISRFYRLRGELVGSGRWVRRLHTQLCMQTTHTRTHSHIYTHERRRAVFKRLRRTGGGSERARVGPSIDQSVNRTTPPIPPGNAPLTRGS
jgi:hypothetical protein